MAVPPTIPTSFVPRQPVQAQARKMRTGTNAFLLIAVVIFGLSALSAAGVFGYQTYLEGVEKSKAAALEKAQQAVDHDTVEGFIRLRNRLLAATTLLNTHVQVSQFFDVLELHTLQNVRFNTLSVKVNKDRTADIEMDGVAKSFNALAAQSNELATEKRVKRAIFSGISVDSGGIVSFKLNATLDSRLIVADPAGAPAASAAEAPAAPASVATTTP